MEDVAGTTGLGDWQLKGVAGIAERVCEIADYS